VDYIDDKKVIHPGGVCAQCGKLISMSLSKEFGLCDVCLEERLSLEEALKVKVRRIFSLRKSPCIRSCFLRLLLSRRVKLEPSGWRTGLALGHELKHAGFSARECEQILIQAGGKAERVNRLVLRIYKNDGAYPLKCEQIKGLNMLCQECPQQFRLKCKETVTEISEAACL
jgi:hypothetical protein